MRSRALARRKGGAIKARKGVSQTELMQLLMGAEAVLICDVSGSMSLRDAGEDGELSRWDVLVDVVNDLVREIESLAIVAFSHTPRLVMREIPPPSGGTDIGAAIRLVIPVSANLKKAVLLSDGHPEGSSDGLTPEKSALKAAQELKVPLSVVYCGPRGGRGATFLERLAGATSGSFHQGNFGDPGKLLGDLRQLLLTDGRKK